MWTLDSGQDRAIKVFLTDHSSFAVLTHINPDGDALGSSFALTSLLRRQGKNAVTVLLDDIPLKYDFPEFGSLFLLLRDVAASDFDAAIAVDCADKKRLGSAQDLFSQLPNASIDHHGSNDMFAQLNHVEESPATAQIIYELFVALGLVPVREAQMAVYMGITADTGNLTYPSTTPQSFSICAELARMGLDTSYVSEQIFNCRTLGATRLIGLFIPKIQLHFDERVAVSLLKLEEIQSVGATIADTEALVNYARDINTVELACFLREMAPCKYKLSLRSKSDRVNVAELAKHYGGGGHARAAGCVLTGTEEEVVAEILQTCRDLFV